MIQATPQTFTQQIMPGIVAFVGVCLLTLGAVVRAVGQKIIKQLQANKIAGDNAASSAKQAAQLAATASLQLAVHNETAGKKLDTIIQQTNGVNEKLQDHIAQQDKVISALQTTQKETRGEIAT